MNSFIDLKKYYNRAMKEGFAIGAFNTSDLEMTQAIASGAAEKKSPVIIQTSPSAIEYAGLQQIFDIVKNEIVENNMSATIHLDHGKDFSIAKSCIDIGYQSVMIDGSELEFDANVNLTKKVVDYAKRHNVSVEGEFGAIGSDDKKSSHGGKTDPKMALEFVEKTGVDSLGVSIGNAHGAPKGEKLDLDLLDRIRLEVSDTPLVIHGSSGLSRKDIREAIKRGVVKFNIDTNLRKAFTKNIEKKERSVIDPREYLGEAREAVSKLVKDYIDIFGSTGKV